MALVASHREKSLSVLKLSTSPLVQLISGTFIPKCLKRKLLLSPLQTQVKTQVGLWVGTVERVLIAHRVTTVRPSSSSLLCRALL